MKEKYLDTNLSFEERARDLVSRMTLWEKASQTVYNAPAVERLGIPAYNWWNESLHGVARAGTATVFPQAIGLAAAFDKKLMGEIADIISIEGRAKYNSASKRGDRDIYKGLTFWSPNINIFRDPRWGRGHETYGEDPYLTACLGKAFVKGLQGNGKHLKSAACAKHFAVHSGPENLRHEFDAQVDLHDLWETYLPAFEALVTEAEVESVMGAYNRVNGEPCCGSETLLKNILRGKWNFKGHVVSDCWALVDFHEHHKVTANANQSVALALKNGCDLNCGRVYLVMLLALQEGLITEEDIDRAVERLMATRLKLGMFDETEYDKIPYSAVCAKEHLETAVDAARRSMVLLKNDGILPLDGGKIKNIAVIGPNADSRAVLLGNYNGTPPKHITILEGIRAIAEKSGIEVKYSEGCHLYNALTPGLTISNDRISEALEIAESADVTVLCLGLDSSIEGEEGDTSNDYAAGDKRSNKFPPPQLVLLKKLAETGKPIILIITAGSAINLTYAAENVSAIAHAWYPGGEGGKAVAELLFGKYSPSGRLPVTIYKTDEELPDFCDYSMKNRTYRYMKNEAFYPFGYGLSYTKFEYSPIEKEQDFSGGEITVSAKVKNIGKMAGYETVQCYVQCENRYEYSPVWQLKGFQPIFLNPDESREVSFSLDEKAFCLVDQNGDEKIINGKYNIYIGGGQPDGRTLELTSAPPVKYVVACQA